MDIDTYLNIEFTRKYLSEPSFISSLIFSLNSNASTTFEDNLKNVEFSINNRRNVYNLIVSLSRNRKFLDIAYRYFLRPIQPMEYSNIGKGLEYIYLFLNVFLPNLWTSRLIFLLVKSLCNFYQHPINYAIMLKNTEAINFFIEKQDLAISDSTIAFTMRFGNPVSMLTSCGIDKIKLLKEANRYQNKDAYLELYLKYDLPNIYTGTDPDVLRAISIRTLPEIDGISECQICFQELNSKADIDCIHTFHLECIRAAATIKCPICSKYLKD